jgi:hypothetical protein
LETKENLGVILLLFWWIKETTIMEEIAQCLSNNITTIVAHLPGTNKASRNRIIGSQI